jgi:hypothetical protein
MGLAEVFSHQSQADFLPTEPTREDTLQLIQFCLPSLLFLKKED